MMTTYDEMSWPSVTIEEVERSGYLYRWRVEPMLHGAPCLNFGVEYSRRVAETKASNYVRLILGEE